MNLAIVLFFTDLLEISTLPRTYNTAIQDMFFLTGFPFSLQVLKLFAWWLQF